MEMNSLLASRDMSSDFLESYHDDETDVIHNFESLSHGEDVCGQEIFSDDEENHHIIVPGRQGPEEICQRHGNKTVDMYCENHAVVGCTVCLMDQSHNNCIKQFIPDLPDTPSADVADLVRELNGIRNEIKLLREETEKDRSRLSTEKNEILQQIENHKDHIISHIQVLADKAKTAVDAEYKLQERRIQELAKEAETKLTELEKFIERLTDVSDNKAQVFVDFVNASTTSRRVAEVVKHLERTPMLNTTKFEINKNMFDVIRDCTSIGSLRSDFRTRIRVQTSTDKPTCDFVGCCALPDGSIVLADKTHRVLRKLDRLMNPVASGYLNHAPGGICTVSRHRLAVTLPTQMRVVFVNEVMRVENRFGVELFCYEVLYHRGLLYVVCRATEQPGSSLDEIRIYNKIGVIQSVIRSTLRHIKPSGNDAIVHRDGLFNTICSLASDTKHLYVASPEGAILQLDSHHRIVSVKCDEQLTGVSGISYYQSRLYVCNRDESKIMTLDIDKTLNELRTLLTEDQGILIPKSVCFNGTSSKILVLVTGSNKVLQFESVIENI